MPHKFEDGVCLCGMQERTFRADCTLADVCPAGTVDQVVIGEDKMVADIETALRSQMVPPLVTPGWTAEEVNALPSAQQQALFGARWTYLYQHYTHANRPEMDACWSRLTEKTRQELRECVIGKTAKRKSTFNNVLSSEDVIQRTMSMKGDVGLDPGAPEGEKTAVHDPVADKAAEIAALLAFTTINPKPRGAIVIKHPSNQQAKHAAQKTAEILASYYPECTFILVPSDFDVTEQG